jgi:hypothetical protein
MSGMLLAEMHKPQAKKEKRKSWSDFLKIRMKHAYNVGYRGKIARSQKKTKINLII